MGNPRKTIIVFAGVGKGTGEDPNARSVREVAWLRPAGKYDLSPDRNHSLTVSNNSYCRRWEWNRRTPECEILAWGRMVASRGQVWSLLIGTMVRPHTAIYSSPQNMSSWLRPNSFNVNHPWWPWGSELAYTPKIFVLC